MNLTDKQAKFAAHKRTHDEMADLGAKCGSQCAIFHKAATPTASKTVERARALTFLFDLGRQIN